VTRGETGPIFTSMTVHRDLEHHYSLFYPGGWSVSELDSAEGTGAIFSPVPDDITTSFSVEARDLGFMVTGDDLGDLRRGFLNGLRQLPEATTERTEDYVVGKLIGLEAWHTFRDGAATRKRWTRLLYQGTLQVRLIGQGANVAEYEFWLPAFNFSMRTFQFGDWWAEVTGQTWQPSLDAAPPGFEDEWQERQAASKPAPNNSASDA
jgi:hypothetical protein